MCSWGRAGRKWELDGSNDGYWSDPPLLLANYGHGGSGWTLAVGCAWTCVTIVEKILHEDPRLRPQTKGPEYLQLQFEKGRFKGSRRQETLTEQSPAKAGTKGNR
ncbi:hypothetical protein QBC40DRAFT_302471 [Triangularia verruculosa]|uniref:FAD dependent oxidoreductase domain-containing protein n=1 Tax=Triangularia verruculosa TaxID=2587418 RepID=A0AAN6X600_9PEZI|nr:hypothetical protein QBC40DRAFT_302471 [Triangularia verruculosa]